MKRFTRLTFSLPNTTDLYGSLTGKVFFNQDQKKKTSENFKILAQYILLYS